MRSSVFNFSIKTKISAITLCIIMLFCMLPIELMAADSSVELRYDKPGKDSSFGVSIEGYPYEFKVGSGTEYATTKYDVGTSVTLSKIESGVEGDRIKSKDGVNFRIYYEWKEWIDNATGKTIGTVNDDGSQTFTIDKTTKVVPVWTLKQYDTITYQWEGEVPAGAPNLPEGVSSITFQKRENIAYRPGDTVPLALCNDFVVADDAGSATLYTFSGWKTNDAKIQNNSFIMPDKAVTLTGSWSNEEAYQITWQWKLGQKGPESIDLEKLPAYVRKNGSNNKIVLPDYANDPNVPAGYKFNGWEIDGVSYNGGDEVTISQNTVISGKWSKTYDKTYPVNTKYEFFGYFDDVDEENKKQEVSNYLDGQITAVPNGTAITQAGEGQEVFLPYLKEKSQIAGHLHCIFIKWHVQDANGKDIELTETTTEDGNKVNKFIMPAGEVTISAVIMRETVTWEVYDKDDASVQLATITRNGMPFDETKPIHGTANLEIYVCDTPGSDVATKKAETTFRFNYSTKGYGCVDLDIAPESGYRLYKVDYDACYGSGGINKTGWRSSDKSIFTMDNITDGSTAKIYLTKTYKVQYNINLEPGITGSVSDYLDDYEQTVVTDVFLGDVAAEVRACTRSDSGHGKCSGNASSIP